MSFDRSNVQSLSAASETGHTFEPVFPGTAQGIGATITVRGPESAIVRNLLRRQLADIQTREMAAKKRGKEPEQPSIEELESQAIDLAVAYTMAWSGIEEDGVPLQASEANLVAFYRDFSWVRRQVIDEAQDLGNFAKPSSKNSSRTQKPSSSSI